MASVLDAIGEMAGGTLGVKALKNTVGNSTFGAMSSSPTAAAINTIPEPSGGSQILHYIVLAIALYMAFKCKGAGGSVDIMQVLLACCCSPCYVAYRLVKPCNS